MKNLKELIEIKLMIHLLSSAIQHHIRMLNINPKNNTQVVSEEVIQNMTNSLTSFVNNSSVKFLKGQIEHGGDIRDRDLYNELAQENYDSFWYGPLGAMGWPKKTK